MKKICSAIVLLLCIMLSGCSVHSSSNSIESNPVELSANDSAQRISNQPEDSVLPVIDLTKMSANMVYAYLDSIFISPEEHIGNCFRIAGVYDKSTWGDLETQFHYIIVADAMACCQLGLEFILTDQNVSYPNSGDRIEISGILTSYEEEDNLFLRIDADELRITSLYSDK